ncbi:MAG TPA: hypothetical protein VGE76_10610, partial [Opitutaceae bacterium]
MNLPEEKSKLPSLPVLIALDFAMLAMGIVVAWRAEQPYTPLSTLLIVSLGIVGPLALLAPVVLTYVRDRDAEIEERQRSLEALGRTVATSAEQLSIAADGLHQIAELAQKNLKQAEDLPARLEETIAGFQAQVTAAADSDREELRREIMALRATESERLESTSQRIVASSAEWARLESSTQQQLSAVTDALSKLQLGTANAIGKAQAAAEQALAQARTEAARSLGETSGQGAAVVDAAKAAALAELAAYEARLASHSTTLTAQLEASAAALSEKVSTTLAT